VVLLVLLVPLCEATVAVSMSFWAAMWFARRVTYQGPFARALGRSSYATYVVHAPIIVALSVGLAGLAVPAEVKFAVVAAIGVAASYSVGWLVTPAARAGLRRPGRRPTRG
jgi:peptidoglycan/LPS O-acetylase OafA/YrhL